MNLVMKSPFAWMLLGGVLVGTGFVAGRSSSVDPHGLLTGFPSVPGHVLHASSASSGEHFSMATGAIDEDAEGVFVLDHLTGVLKCAVLNHRTGKFSALFQRNVSPDLGGLSKNAKYQMVTGLMNFQRGASIVRPGLSVVYVLDATSGRMMAYGIPWQREAATTGRPQLASLLPIDVLQARTVQVRAQE